MTDDQGAYHLPSLPPGIYDIKVYAGKGVPPARRVTIKEGEVVTADFVVDPAVEVPGLGKVHPCYESAPSGTGTLGRSLGPIDFTLRASEIRAILGPPRQEFPLKGDLLRWLYERDIVTVWGPADRDEANALQDFATRDPKYGRTVEGLQIGDPLARFGQIYQGFPVCLVFPGTTAFRIDDRHGTVLTIEIDGQNRVSSLRIEDSRCDSNSPDPCPNRTR
jgi:hypothetical protein